MENTSLKVTNDSPACRVQLLSLPGELLAKIMAFAMASDVPVYLWLFRNIARDSSFAQKNRDTKLYLPVDLSPTCKDFPTYQERHLLDWLCVTGTCHRLRRIGMPAFFREKEFLIPPTMLRGLQDGTIRSSNLDMAKDCIREVVVPVSNFVNGTGFMSLPKCHHFTRLSTLTILAPSDERRILQRHVKDKARPQEPPKELRDLLGQLGLRINEIKLRLVIVADTKSDVTSVIDSMERGVYPLLRTLIQRRVKSRVVPT